MSKYKQSPFVKFIRSINKAKKQERIVGKGITIEGLPSNIYHKCDNCGHNKFRYMDDWSKLTDKEIATKEKEEKIYLQCVKCLYPTHD